MALCAHTFLFIFCIVCIPFKLFSWQHYYLRLGMNPDSPVKTIVFSPSPGCRSPQSKEILSNGYNNARAFLSYIQQWIELQRKGTLVCRSFRALRLHELIDETYPSQLAGMCDSLADICDSMIIIVESMQTVVKQYGAISKLETSGYPLFNTWSATKLYNELNSLCEMISDETKIKILIKENIAHCRSENITEVYISVWEYNTAVDMLKLENFLTEISDKTNDNCKI